jgi:hypothetical protein
MADTIEIIQGTATTVEVAGPTGPQGPAGATGATGAQGPAGTGIETLTTQGDLLYRGASTALRLGIGTTGQVLKVAGGIPAWEAESGGVPTSRTISAGTGLTGGGDLTANRTLAVSYGTTAGTACEGNDGRISGIQSGSIVISGSTIVANSEGFKFTGADPILGAIDVSDNGGGILTYSDGGTINTSAGGGSINTRGTGSIELGVTGTRTTLNGSAATTDKTVTLPNATGTVALTQQATDYEVTDSSAGIIMKSPNNSRWRITIDNNGVLLRTALTLLFSLAFMCGAKAQVRDLVYGTNNVVIGPTNGNALAVTNSVAFSNPITFGTNAPTTRTNLGVTVASNLPAPYSGAAATNSLLTADGAGGSSFVASRNTYLRATNVAFSNSITPTNITGMSWTVLANKTYMVSVSAIIDQQAGGYDVRIQWPSALIYTNATNTSGSGVAAVGSGAFTPVWTTNTNNLRLFTRGGASLPQQATAFVMVATGTNGGTASFQICQSSSNATATTLTLLTASIEEL